MITRAVSIMPSLNDAVVSATILAQIWMGSADKKGKKLIVCSDEFSHGSLGAHTAIVACVVAALKKAILVMCVPETQLVFSTPWEHGGVVTSKGREASSDGKGMPTDVDFRARVEKALLITKPIVFDQSLPSSAFRGMKHAILQKAAEVRLGRRAAAAAAAAAAATM